MNASRRFRFSLRSLLLAATAITILFARWYTTSSRRAAYERLIQLDCGLLASPDDVLPYSNPHDFLSVRSISPIGDMISPPQLISIHIRDSLADADQSTAMLATTAFPELESVLLPPDASDTSLASWRRNLPTHVNVNRIDER